MPEIVMPRLSDSMEEGTVLKWLKAVGEEVAVGEELVEIETDKANMVYESDAAGTLVEILAAEGATLPIGEAIARVGDASDISADGGAAPGAGADSAATPREPPPSPAREPVAPVAAVPPASGDRAGEGARVKASPLARRIARERGVELASLAGSGPGGRIIKRDVESAPVGPAGPGAGPGAGTAVALATPGPGTAGAPAPETAKGAVETVELTKLQRTVARRMAESKATAPHFYLSAEVDMSAAVEGRERLKAAAGAGAGREAEQAAPVVPTYNDMVVKACALALREFPRANGAYRDGRVELYSRVNVGVAVAANDALVVPTVFDADRKGLRQISAEARALAERVRSGEITPPELSGGTFTVSNLGMFGVTSFGAVINAPQAAILAVGELAERPAVIDGEVLPRHLMGVTLACDHRILYGADGARLLARVRALLEEPLGLAL